MTRLSFETGRCLALFSLCSCSLGLVDAEPASAPAPSSSAASTSNELPPAAARSRARSESSDAAAAGRAALEMKVALGAAGAAANPLSPRARVFGVTITDVSPLEGITEALGGLSRKPTTRIVFDAERGAITYVPAVREIAKVSYIMGELVDSVAVADMSLDVYASRTSDYLNELGDLVDIWEVGNEVNGQWLGPAEGVSAKIAAAYALVSARDKPTALTLYYNDACVQDTDHELFTWAATHVPAALRDGLDYVWVSYYEQRCHQPEPDWDSVFARLRELFPHAALGIGGCGAKDPASKAVTLQHFYSLDVDVPGFVGGFFWWYFREDMQPSGKPLWSLLDSSWQKATR